jgi:hypothetical protein
VQGALQPQTTLVATGSLGVKQDFVTNGHMDSGRFKAAFLSYSNFKIPYSDRLFFTIWAASMYKPQNAIYIDGTNDSKKDSAIISAGKSTYLYSTLKYVLPIGEGIDNPEGLYSLKNGFVMGREGYGGGMPFVTGRTSLGIKSFYQTQDIQNWKESEAWSSFDSEPQLKTDGLRLFMLHDNTDFDLNPSRGYSFQIQYSKDWGDGDNLQKWDFLEFKFNKYFSLEKLPYTQQNVLALSFWTGYSFSWDSDEEAASGINQGQPPMWEGGRLGGYFRLRGYDNNRFSGKAVIYGTAEYRAILEYNPFKTTKFLKNNIPISIDWLQVVPFVEAGRVNDRYDNDLLKDLKYDAGLSLRAFAAGLPVRFDVAYGEEGAYMWVMIQQPFDF